MKINFIIIIFLVTFFSCQQKKDNLVLSESDFGKYINPIKLDSMLDEKYLLDKYFLSENVHQIFNFQLPIASAKIYENLIDENGKLTYPDYPEHFHSEIYFTKFGKLSSFENVEDKKKITVIYNDKNLIQYFIIHEKDSYSKEEKDDITKYEYDEYGNLLSSLNYKKAEQGLDFWHYNEYKYSIENGNIVVTRNNLEKFASYYFNQDKFIFDQQKRIIKKESYSQNVLVRGREITTEEKYYYENGDFPNKITKIEAIAKTDKSRRTETFVYNAQGKLINYTEHTVPEIYFTTKKINYLPKNEVEFINEHKTLRSYEVMGAKIEPDIQSEHKIKTFDNFGNPIKIEDIKNRNEINYLKYTYKFDDKGNWIEKLVQEHTFIPKEYLNEDVKEDSYINYRREISYTNYKEYTFDKLEDSEAENFKNRILKENKFHETFERLK